MQKIRFYCAASAKNFIKKYKTNFLKCKNSAH